MTSVFPLIQCDFYKQSHYKMYPDGLQKLYSNFTPRKSRIDGVKEVVVFGIQYFIKEYLVNQWNRDFFFISQQDAVGEFERFMKYTLGENAIGIEHISELHDLGYLPIKIKAIEEGKLCPIGVPCITITNTHPRFAWLVNFLETIISCTVWQPMTSATIARQYRLLLDKYAFDTTDDNSFVDWQGHDFSMRGMSSLESACTSGAGHLLYFRGTDTIPAIAFLEEYYNADISKQLVGTSVPATEHSVMCCGTKDDEVGTFETLLDKFTNGILSVVSDTWDLWKVCTEYLPLLKDRVMAREGKLVIRPDSGDPVYILTGYANDELIFENGKTYYNEAWVWGEKVSGREISECERKGVIELLWEIFGGTTNKLGYKELDSHIGCIYGDSITLERAHKILFRLKNKGFASTNVVLGIGSYTYQYNTRDTFGFACKATYAVVNDQPINIYKDPVTDDGTKRSAKGLLALFYDPVGRLELLEQCDEEYENKGELQTVFEDGNILVDLTLQQIKNNCINNK
jgi:nicotinamide phosphoribosyltransferase